MNGFVQMVKFLFSIPFYLANDSLVKLEYEKMGYVEGGSKESFLSLLRHEAGHCFDNAYGISVQSNWKQYFGSSQKAYKPESYTFNPYSTDYVINLEDHYAQMHPSEDFAETFAVYLELGDEAFFLLIKSGLEL